MAAKVFFNAGHLKNIYLQAVPNRTGSLRGYFRMIIARISVELEFLTRRQVEPPSRAQKAIGFIPARRTYAQGVPQKRNQEAKGGVQSGNAAGP
jgi:hypothetical protein